MSVEHYENFPVASWCCPPAIRPAVVAIYRFARTADDLADEGDAPAEQRLADLADFRADLAAVASSAGPVAPSARWPQVFGPLRQAIVAHRLPVEPLGDLLSAFEQDCRPQRYRRRADLLDYCRRSANPVGRLLLHLHGVDAPDALRRSDAVCTALQLANFWQDLSVDLPRGRLYVPLDDLARHGIDPAMLAAGRRHPATEALIRRLVRWSRATMQQGASVVHRVPGRGGWELRLVVQGGLRILERVERLGAAATTVRPTLGALDLPTMLWRAARMRAPRPPAPADDRSRPA